ncbi:MAG TPA: hypothetical protein VEG38_22780 [Acidimicrobiia bacterium]|nr:hypothetical protein [Acidimicrobiia bacterium]
MREMVRRAWHSNASRFFWTGLLGLAVAAPAAGGSPASPSIVAHQACSGATATRDYTADAMTFRLRLDLAGCNWWDGSARDLVVFLSRDDGSGPANRYSMIPCEQSAEPNADRTTVCEVFSTVHHPADEEAVAYQGEATWKWRDGERRVSFETRCTTTQGQSRCDDPVSTWHD